VLATGLALADVVARADDDGSANLAVDEATAVLTADSVGSGAAGRVVDVSDSLSAELDVVGPAVVVTNALVGTAVVMTGVVGAAVVMTVRAAVVITGVVAAAVVMTRVVGAVVVITGVVGAAVVMTVGTAVVMTGVVGTVVVMAGLEEEEGAAVVVSTKTSHAPKSHCAMSS